MTKSNNEWAPGKKVKLVEHLAYEDILLYGHECVGEELEIKAVFMDGGTEVCAVNLDSVNYCFASQILESIKTEAEKRRDEFAAKIGALVCKADTIGFTDYQTEGEYLYDQGCRILSLNQFIATKLSDVERSALAEYHEWDIDEINPVLDHALKLIGAPE